MTSASPSSASPKTASPKTASPKSEPPDRDRPKLDLRARIALPLCAALLMLLAVHRMFIAENTPVYVEFTGRTMGTTYSVKVAEASLTSDQRAWLTATIDDQLDRVNALMSTYIDDSELSRLNRHRSTQAFRVSQETLAVFEISRRVSEMSGGAFDVTVGPLVAAWGFGATDRPPAPPSEQELVAIRNRVGYEKISLQTTDASIVKHHPETECDLSAIAKGYGVDRIAEALSSEGYLDFLVEVGGELRARGSKGEAGPWRVGIERPDAEVRSTERVIALRDMALATSGDYRNYYEVDGVRISHTIDPRLGRPIRHRLASVSVLHPEAVWADALATTLNVLGPVEGLVWAEENEIAALLIVREPDGKFRISETSAFRALQDVP